MKFHSDCGHGWLEVTYKEIESLGIADRISCFSYRKGNKVYLEEDCDMDRFFRAKYGEDYQKDRAIQEMLRNIIPFQNYKGEARGIRNSASFYRDEKVA